MAAGRRRWSTWSALLVMTFAWPSAAAAEPGQVLLLHSFERDYAPFDTFAGTFRTELSRQSNSAISYFDVSLQPLELNERPHDKALLDYLANAFAGRPLDLVVAIGGPASAFAQEHRRVLFPETPLLLAAVDRRIVDRSTLAANDAAVTVENDPSQLVENILHLLPETTHLFVVIGVSPLERFWRDELGRELERFKERLTLVWFDQLSFAEMLERSAALPPHSVIFYPLLFVDAQGVPHSENRALPQLHAVANAPILGLHSTQLGRGVIGGPLMSIDDLSRNAVGVALRILQGESPASVRTPPQRPGPFAYDWRELRRWGISEDRLPRGSTVLFREQSLWERYRWQIAAGVSIGIVETLLVVAMLAMHLRRRRAELTLRESEERFRRLSDTAPVMIWMSGPDKGCTDFNRPWLDFTGRSIDAELGDGWSEGVHPDDLERCLETYNQAFNRHAQFKMEYRLRRYDGEYRWIFDTGVPRFTPDGAFVGFIGSAVDVTENKQAEAALASFSHRLMEAQEQERSWIARELHDDLSQRMVGLTLQLRSFGQSPPPRIEDFRSRVSDLCRQLDDVGRDIQAVSHRLHSSKLEFLGLVAAADSFCREVSAQHGVRIDVSHVDVPRDLPKDVALGLFRVMQEAVVNALKHSGMRHFAVALRGGPDEIQLEVVDSGIGFDPQAALSRYGLGLISMRERLGLIDGQLYVDSRPGAGTRIRARVPLRRRRKSGVRQVIGM